MSPARKAPRVLGCTHHRQLLAVPRGSFVLPPILALTEAGRGGRRATRPKWVEITGQSDDLVVHKWSRPGPIVHRAGDRSASVAVELPGSTTEVVKVTDSVPTSGQPDRASRAVVAKAGVANAVGAYGERLAARYLVESGMQILDRNWRCDQGEIDIVAMDDTALVIVEVKTRRSLAFGSPVEAVTAVKAARLRRLACCWLTENRSLVDSVTDIRIDVIGVLRPLSGPAQIEHLVAVAA
jgi:putative endonuclease